MLELKMFEESKAKAKSKIYSRKMLPRMLKSIQCKDLDDDEVTSKEEICTILAEQLKLHDAEGTHCKPEAANILIRNNKKLVVSFSMV